MSKTSLQSFKNCLSHLAFKAEDSKGRRDREDEDEAYFRLIDPYKLDRIKLSSSRARRRLRKKCQVFCDPASPHVRDRGIHTNEARDIGSILAHILGCNANLVEAILEGHDIGHAPIGHFGEEYLSMKTGKVFCHGLMGVVIAQQIERAGLGLNLTKEVLLGIKHHPGGSPRDIIGLGLPQELGIAKVADRLQYFFGDFNDAQRFGLLGLEAISQVTTYFGRNQREQTLKCIEACVEESYEMGTVSFDSSPVAVHFENLRNWLYEEIYPKFQIYFSIHREVLDHIYELFSNEDSFSGADPAVLIALMTDHEVNEIAKIFLRTKRPRTVDIREFGIMEIIPDIQGKNIDFAQSDLDW